MTHEYTFNMVIFEVGLKHDIGVQYLEASILLAYVQGDGCRIFEVCDMKITAEVWRVYAKCLFSLNSEVASLLFEAAAWCLDIEMQKLLRPDLKLLLICRSSSNLKVLTHCSVFWKKTSCLSGEPHHNLSKIRILFKQQLCRKAEPDYLYPSCCIMEWNYLLYQNIWIHTLRRRNILNKLFELLLDANNLIVLTM